MKYIITFYIVLISLGLFGQNEFSSSNLPIVIINTNNQTIPADEKISANMKIVYNGEGQRNAVTDVKYNYSGYIGIKLRGNSSLSFDQKQYTIETRNSAGENLNVSLLDMPKDNDWVIHAPYNDISLIRNVLAYDLWTEMGHWGPRTRMVELVLNGNYQGVYVLTETIKRDKNRINITKLESSDITGLDITGGYIMRIDASNSDDDITFQSKVAGIGTGFNKSVVWLYHYPDPTEIHPQQITYIHNYIDTVELLIQSVKFNDPANGYSKYLDLQSFVDYFIHTELSLNSDGYKRSAYFYKERLAADGTGGKFYAGSVWDFNLAFGNCNFCKGNQINAWVYNGCETLPVPAIWKRLIQDPNFINTVKCRYLELRKGILSDSYLHSFIDDYALLLDEAQSRHFKKWNDLLGTGMNMKLWFSAYRVTSYTQEIGTLKNWLSSRLNFLDNNLGGTCLPSLVDDRDNKSSEIFVFPNPTTDAVVIESSVPISYIEIFSINGQKMTAKTINNLNRIVLPEFRQYPEGLYLLLLHSEDGIHIRKTVMKQ
jgi:hypothetical protein